MLHCRLRILRLIVSRISLLGYNIEGTINKIFYVCWLLTSGDKEQNGCVVRGWGGQMLWEAEVLEGLYGAKDESGLTKTQNS